LSGSGGQFKGRSSNMDFDHLPHFDVPVDVIVPINRGVIPLLLNAS